jgi:sugar lactone lactonase YvrE
VIPDFRRIGRQTDILGECPVWDDRREALFWVDIRAPAIRRYDPRQNRIDSWTMPALVGAIALTEGEELVVALPDRIALWLPGSDKFKTLAKNPDPRPGHRFNDGRVDRQGRFWVGTMHNETRGPEGVLYRLDGAELVPILDRICIPNSLAWSPDGATMYFADSLEYAIWAYDFAPRLGEPSARRVLAKTTAPGFPDGSAVDEHGFLWNAEFNSGRIVRYAPDGTADRILETPVGRPTCCAFGGPGLDVLYVTTTSQNMSPEERRSARLDGALLAIEPGVRGLPEARCRLPETKRTPPT